MKDDLRRPGRTALDTARARIPNPYARRTTDVREGHSVVEVLSTTECWRLLENEAVGRLAVHRDDDAPDLCPVNFRAYRGKIYLRSSPGGKLRSLRVHPAVAFEVDRSNSEQSWSVVIRGVAERMDDDAEIEACGILGLVSSNPTPKHNFIRLTPSSISGRRFDHVATSDAPRRRAAQSSTSSSLDAPGTPGAHTKPIAIPHLAPMTH